MLDYFVSSVPAEKVSSDPVVVVIPIGWMKKIINKYPVAFDIFISNMFTVDKFDIFDYDREGYTQSLNGNKATIDDLNGWITATKEMIEEEVDYGLEAWEYMRKNIPADVMMGFDMEIGVTDVGPAFRKLMQEFESVDRLIIPIHQIIDANGNPFPNNDIISMLSSAHIDRERTIKIMDNGTHGDAIKIGIISNDAVEDFFSKSGLIPKGLYRLMNLSDVNRSPTPSSINYYKLKI